MLPFKAFQINLKFLVYGSNKSIPISVIAPACLKLEIGFKQFFFSEIPQLAEHAIHHITGWTTFQWQE